MGSVTFCVLEHSAVLGREAVLSQGSGAERLAGRASAALIVRSPEAGVDQSAGCSFHGCCKQQCETSGDHGEKQLFMLVPTVSGQC